MDDVRGCFFGLPHGTTPAAVTTNKNIKMSSFKSSENRLSLKSIYVYECRPSNKTDMCQFFKINQALMNSVDKTLNCILPSGTCMLPLYNY